MKLVSYRGNAVNDGTNYVGGVLPPIHGLPAVTAQRVQRHGRWPLISGLARPGVTITLLIIIKGASQDALREQLYQYFDPENETPGQLIVADNDGSNTRYVLALCESLQEAPGSAATEFVATMAVDGDVRWRAAAGASEDTWNVGSSGATTVVANNGEDEAYPIFTITPRSGKSGGYLYRRWIPVRWNADTAALLYPVNLTNVALDTAALVSGGKMQADGDDLRVRVNGVEVDRWLNLINTTTTSVWANLDFQPRQEVTLATAIASSGAVTTIEVNEDIGDFPTAGIVMIDSEAFTYQSRDEFAKTFSGVSRAARSTSMAAHSAAATVWWVQNDVYLLYGDSTATAPTVPDTYKPMLDLGFPNDNWYVIRFGSFDYPDRRPQWSYGADLRPNSVTKYYAPQSPEDDPVDPWTAVGLWLAANQEQPGQARAWWQFYNPCGVTDINLAEIDVFQDSDLSYWDELGVYAAGADGTFALQEVVTAPDTHTTWQLRSVTTLVLPADTQYLRFRLQNTTDAYYDSQMDVYELDVEIDNYPTVTIGSEASNYDLSATLTNNTTGQAITLTFAMSIDDPLVVDTDGKTVTDEGGNSQLAALALSSVRRDWLKLIAGNNTLQYDETGVTDVDVDWSFEERYYD